WELLSNCIHLEIVSNRQRTGLDQSICNLDIKIPNCFLRTTNSHNLFMKTSMLIRCCFRISTQHEFSSSKTLNSRSPTHLEMFLIIENSYTSIVIGNNDLWFCRW